MKSISILGIFVADLAFFGKIPLKGETVLGDKFVVGPGGKGSNQAVAAAKAGAEVNFISQIGNDDYGKMAKKIYIESKIGTKNLIISDEHSTGVAAILLNKETGDNAISVIPGAAGAITIDNIKAAENEIKNSSVFLTQLEVPVEVSEYAINIAKLHNVTTILNPAPAATINDKTFELIDYFTPNETEASFYVNHKVETHEEAKKAANQLLDKGIKNIIITLGEKGAYFANKKESFYINAFDLKDKVVDTTGAGDAFNGGFAVGLTEGKNIKDAIHFANAVAGLSTTKIGTAKSMPLRSEIDNFL